MGETMKLIMMPSAYRRMMGWVRASEKELSGVGRVQVINGNFVVPEVFLLSTKDTFGRTEITAQTMGPFLYEYEATGGKPEELKLWWHSHNSMGVFWSPQTDMNAILNEPMGATPQQVGWWLSLVTNHRGEWKARYDDRGRRSIDLDLHVPYHDDDGGPFVEEEARIEVESRMNDVDRSWDVEFFCDTYLTPVHFSSCFMCDYQFGCDQFRDVLLDVARIDIRDMYPLDEEEEVVEDTLVQLAMEEEEGV